MYLSIHYHVAPLISGPTWLVGNMSVHVYRMASHKELYKDLEDATKSTLGLTRILGVNPDGHVSAALWEMAESSAANSRSMDGVSSGVWYFEGEA